jgi:hypothetical protein
MLTRSLLFLPIVLIVAACGGGSGSSSPPVASAPPPAPTPTPTPTPTPAPTPPPGGMQSTQATATAISIQWDNVTGAVDYRILRDNVQVMLAEDTQSRFREMDLTPNTSYAYAVEALDANGTVLKRMTFATKTASGAADLTDADVPPTDVVRARSLTSFGWTPNPLYDTCSKALHDSFWTFGPDNKAYATWHPPIYEFANGTTCRFGHEHGQDQRQSNLFKTVGAIPFGYVNEQLSPTDPAFQRNEDHAGHKVAMFNGLLALDENNQTSTFTCDVLFKLHQGTHSPDALRNNSHERFLNYQCGNGVQARWKGLQAFGSPNSFQEVIQNKFTNLIQTLGAVPGQPGYGADRRIIPTNLTLGIDPNVGQYEYQNVDQIQPDGSKACDTCRGANGLPAYVSQWNNETWQGGPGLYIKDAADKLIYSFGGGPYWLVQNSSRYYDPNGNPDPTNNTSYKIGRQIDLCYDASKPGYPSLDCQLVRARTGNGPRIAFDDPRSPFKGTVRFNEVNFLAIINTDPANTRLYATPYGDLRLPTDGNVSRVRTAARPIRIYASVTPQGANYNIRMANFAGSQQVGGPFGHGRLYTDFSVYKLKNGTIVDAGIHIPN